MTEDEKRRLLKKALSGIDRRPPMSSWEEILGLNRPIDYQLPSRSLFVPNDAFPIYSKDPEPLCSRHAKKRSECDRPDCVVEYVIDE